MWDIGDLLGLCLPMGQRQAAHVMEESLLTPIRRIISAASWLNTNTTGEEDSVAPPFPFLPPSSHFPPSPYFSPFPPSPHFTPFPHSLTSSPPSFLSFSPHFFHYSLLSLHSFPSLTPSPHSLIPIILSFPHSFGLLSLTTPLLPYLFSLSSLSLSHSKSLERKEAKKKRGKRIIERESELYRHRGKYKGRKEKEGRKLDGVN